MTQKGPASGSEGFTTMKFRIDGISKGMAMGGDSFNRSKKVPLSLLPGKGPYPQAGEQWIISKTINGVWSFTHIINAPAPPAITGSRSGGEALTNLLTQLA